MSPNLRLYVRRRGRVGRWYGDFRAYADVGGAQEPLRAPGERLATTDQEEAWRLALRRLDELRALRRGEPVVVAAAPMPLGAYVTHHLHALRASGRVGAARLDTSALYLERALDFFGRERTVNSIRVKDVRGWAEAIGQRLGGKGGRAGERRPLSGASVRGHLFVLSKLFRRAVEEELVTVNPVAAMMDKPGRTVREAAYLEVPDAAVYLEAARTLPPLANNPDAMGAAFAYALIGTFLLTGGRMSEVLGLELEDVSFDRKTVTFRPNAWRGLKTRTSHRVVPLWPQLEEILRPFVFGERLPQGGRLLFPSFRTGREAMLREPRKLLERVAARAGLAARDVRTKAFRHTYCAARLQTLDHGATVSTYTVSRELGHGSEDMVRRVYAHLGQVRHRSEVVEYRVGQHLDVLRDRLQALGFGTILGPSRREAPERTTPHASITDGGAQGYGKWARRDSNARPLAPEASALSS